MMALDLRNDWRTVEQPKPWRPIILTLATAFSVAGILFLQQPNLAAAAPPPAPTPPAATVEAPALAPPPIDALLAPSAPEPAASAPAAAASTPAPAHKKKKHAASAVSADEQTRRALLRLQREQLDRATSSP
jgi:hypothetical protein